MTENNMKDYVKLSIPNKPEYVSIARLTASGIANRLGFDIDDIEDIKVAIGEACTNAIKHGLKSKSDNYDIEFIVEEDTLTISVKDTGTGTCSVEVKEPNAQALKENGLGLFIINTLMDKVECISEEGKGTEIRMMKRIGVGVQ